MTTMSLSQLPMMIIRMADKSRIRREMFYTFFDKKDAS